MPIRNMLALAAALSIAATATAQAPQCPKWEAGARYPWQSDKILRDDLYAWMILDVDRRGYPVRCGVAKNNYPDPESRVWLCKQYLERWRGPPATAAEPKRRTLMRFALIPGPKHDLADKRARPIWFRQHPQQRPECYPEPSRPDRMDL